MIFRTLVKEKQMEIAKIEVILTKAPEAKAKVASKISQANYEKEDLELIANALKASKLVKHSREDAKLSATILKAMVESNDEVKKLYQEVLIKKRDLELLKVELQRIDDKFTAAKKFVEIIKLERS